MGGSPVGSRPRRIRMDDQPNRIGFRLQVRPELIDEYRARHADVWPEMRDARAA